MQEDGACEEGLVRAQDCALANVAMRSGDRVQASDADALYRRLGLRIVPFLLLCYLVAMIDRLNVGFAKLQFLHDLHFSETVFGTAAGILYVGYILFEIPSNLVLDRSGVRLTLLRIMVAWGVFTMLLAFARSETSFYALRFLIGAAEAGFFPGIVLYLTFWFPDRYRGKVTSVFAMGVPVAGLVAGPLSGLIMTRLDAAVGLRGWQWLFLLEGAPAIVLGVAAYAFLADRPGSAAFLNAGEKARIARDLAADLGRSRQGKLDRFAEAVRSPRIYLLAVVYFTFYSMQSVLLIWVPTLLKAVGVTSLVAIGWRAGAISLAGAIGMVAIATVSDRTGERRWHLVGCGLLASTAFLLLPSAAGSADGTTLLLAVAAVFIFGFLGLFWTVPAAFLERRAAAGGIAMISSIGASGSAVSPIFIGWMRDHTGSLYASISTLAILFIAGTLLMMMCVPRAGGAAAVAASSSA